MLRGTLALTFLVLLLAACRAQAPDSPKFNPAAPPGPAPDGMVWVPGGVVPGQPYRLSLRQGSPAGAREVTPHSSRPKG
jgi:hypothetical protein